MNIPEIFSQLSCRYLARFEDISVIFSGEQPNKFGAQLQRFRDLFCRPLQGKNDEKACEMLYSSFIFRRLIAVGDLAAVSWPRVTASWNDLITVSDKYNSAYKLIGN
jgi:hypothetical protein